MIPMQNSIPLVNAYLLTVAADEASSAYSNPRVSARSDSSGVHILFSRATFDDNGYQCLNEDWEFSFPFAKIASQFLRTNKKLEDTFGSLANQWVYTEPNKIKCTGHSKPYAHYRPMQRNEAADLYQPDLENLFAQPLAFGFDAKSREWEIYIDGKPAIV